jgi:hypothetical protein
MESRIIFDVSAKPFAWEPIWASAGAFVFGCGILLTNRLKLWPRLSKKWGYFMILCAVITASYDASRWYLYRRNYLRALASGHYEVVEGVVQNLHPMPDDGSSNESFTVAGHAFSYSDYHDLETTTCFNQTTPHRGPVHAGMFLRVKYVDDCILQIEALPENSPTGPK